MLAAGRLPAQTTKPFADFRPPVANVAYTPLPSNDHSGKARPIVPIGVGEVPAELRKASRLSNLYRKFVIVRGVPIVGSVQVSDWALLEAAYLLDHSLQDCPPKVEAALIASGCRVGVIGVYEFSMDVPENRWERDHSTLAEQAFADKRRRGNGGVPLAGTGEENLLNLHGDPYKSENILIHEFAHTIADALKIADPSWYEKLKATYQHAMETGLFKDTYSASNEQEYWAEGVQMWFDCGVVAVVPKVHNGIWTRDQIKQYDPQLAALLADVYGDGKWRYVRSDNRPMTADGVTYTRTPAELSHLAGLDRDGMPTFSFDNSPRVRAAAATQQTTQPATTPKP